MKCTLARQVWGNESGPIEGLKQQAPEVFERLSGFARGFAEKGNDPFDAQAKKMVGDGPFLVVHADDNDPVAELVHDVVADAAMSIVLSDYFSNLHGQPMVFGNVCCSGCITQDGTLDNEWIIEIQKAAILIE